MASCDVRKKDSEAPEKNTTSSESSEAQTPDRSALSLDFDTRIKEAADAGFSSPGEQIYAETCAACHDNPEQMRVPGLPSLKAMNPAQIQFSLKSGKMKMQAESLNRIEIGLLMDYLAAGDGHSGYSVSEIAKCASEEILFDEQYLVQWGVEPENSRYYSPARTKITKENVSQLTVAWAFGLPGTSELRSQPVITQDTLFVSTTSGHMFALDRFSGCVKWHRELAKPIRTPLTLGKIEGEPVLFFADASTTAYAMKAKDGSIIWQQRTGIFPESMSTGGIVQHEDKLIVPLSSFDVAAAMNPQHECCKSHGAVVALDVKTGKRIWLARMMGEAVATSKSSVGTQLWGPSGAPVWTTPTIDVQNGRIYIGTGENTSAPATDTSDSIIALDLATGKRLWVYQATKQDMFNMACHPLKESGPNCPNPSGPDYDFGGSVTFAVMSDGREVVVGGQKSGAIHAVDAATGEQVWTTKVSSGSPLGGTHWGVSVSNGRVFAPSSDPPYPLENYEAKPGLYVLDLDTGEMLWSYQVERGCDSNWTSQMTDLEPWPDCSFFFGFSAAPSSTDDVVFIGALDGKIRGFDTGTGELLWIVETKREFETVNAVTAHGGAIDNAGIQLAGNMLFVQSGYSMFGQMPGNALVAFRVQSAEGAK